MLHVAPIADATLDPAYLLRALRAFKKGDFTARLAARCAAGAAPAGSDK